MPFFDSGGGDACTLVDSEESASRLGSDSFGSDADGVLAALGDAMLLVFAVKFRALEGCTLGTMRTDAVHIIIIRLDCPATFTNNVWVWEMSNMYTSIERESTVQTEG